MPCLCELVYLLLELEYEGQGEKEGHSTLFENGGVLGAAVWGDYFPRIKIMDRGAGPIQP